MSRSTDKPAGSEIPVTRKSRRSLTPPTWLLVILGGVVALAIATRFANLPGDHAAANVLMFLGFFLAGACLLLWFLLFSGCRIRTRLLTLGAVIGVIVAGGALFKVEELDGELVPTFAFRWTPAADQLLDAPIALESQSGADLTAVSANDFPEFLGSGRTGRVEGVELSSDWTLNPPKLLWRKPIGAGWAGFVVVNGFAVTLEQRGEEEMITCYSVESGDPVWSHGIKTRHETVPGGIGPRGTPTIHDGKVYALGAEGTLHCLNGANGEVIWQDNILDRYGVPRDEDKKGVAWGRSASPLVVDDLLIVPVGGPASGPHVSLTAFNRNTGEVVWEAGDRQVSYASPVSATLAGKRQILSVNQDNVSAHEPQDGALLWDYDWPGNSTANPNVSQPMFLGGDQVLLSKGYGGGALLLRVAVDETGALKASEIWRSRRVLKTKFTNVVLHEGHLYGLSDGILECVDAEDGTRRWKGGRYGHGQLLGVGALFILQAESGDVVLIEPNPDEHREIGRFAALEGKTWNNPCLYGRFLLVRNAEEAACLELPVAELSGE